MGCTSDKRARLRWGWASDKRARQKKLAPFQWGWGASYEAAPPRGTSQPPSSGLEVPMRLMAFNHRELARAAGRGTRRWRRKLAHPNCQHRAHEIDTVGCCRSSTLLLCARSHTTGPRCCVELAPIAIAACSGDAKATVWRCHAARVMQMAGRSDRWGSGKWSVGSGALVGRCSLFSQA